MKTKWIITWAKGTDCIIRCKVLATDSQSAERTAREYLATLGLESEAIELLRETPSECFECNSL